MWLNLGAGEYYQLGWHNVDHGSPHRVDEQVDLTGPLPWEAGSVTRVYMGHVLEHLDLNDCAKLLARLHEVTAPGGEAMVVGPDVHRAAAMHARGKLSSEWLRLVREGGCRWPGDAHLWLCEPDTVVRLLVEAGWREVREVPIWLVPDVWPVVAHLEWQCAVQAIA